MELLDTVKARKLAYYFIRCIVATIDTTQGATREVWLSAE